MSQNVSDQHPSLRPYRTISIFKSWCLISLLSMTGFICARAYALFVKEEQMKIQKRIAEEYGLNNLTNEGRDSSS